MQGRENTLSGRRMSAFATFLRTGRRHVHPLGTDIEVKFNPWHDPDDGRFTFVGQGRYFGAGSGPDDGDRGSGTRGKRAEGSDSRRFDPRNPVNHSPYIVRPGDTLAMIAQRRKGLTAKDLAWLNDVSRDHPLRAGQSLKIPHQSYLDAGRDAKNRFVALSYYMDTHGGRLPPNPANPPSIDQQIREGTHVVSKNGYDFHIDTIGRTQRVTGELSGQAARRSRSAQARAGGTDRLPGDDGGHYIARRFNGPPDSFNHFAQDANFNRGRYRVLEDKLEVARRSGKRVFVDIRPTHDGLSKRPVRITVSYTIDGNQDIKDFHNAKGR